MAAFLDTVHNQVLIGDGAMGTMLVQKGLPPGECPELWMLDNPDKVREIHREYLDAGSQVIQTNTFGATSLKLAEYNASSRVEEINITAARLVREAVGTKAFVAGIVGPTGQLPYPLGNISWLDLVDVFARQVEALEKGGVDLIFLETFSDLGEIRAALYAAKQFTHLPVACSLTYSKGRTLTGTTPEVAAAVLSAMGADLVGANCSTGPAELLDIMKAYKSATNLPLLVEPNAGIPELIGGKTVFKETPQEMAMFMEPFRSIGVNLIGACCGSTPAHLKAMSEALKSRELKEANREHRDFPTRLASRSKCVSLGQGELPLIIGERINPTARKAISLAFKEENWDLITLEGIEQVKAGAQLLDLNTGVPGLDEEQLLVKGVQHLQMTLDTPLVLDSTNPKALEKGLQEYHGKALINSVNGEAKSLDTILPLAKKYGAAVLGLTLNENGIPEKAEGRLEIARHIVKKALEYGLAREDILIDCLVLTAATDPGLSMETIRAISLVKKELGVATVLGLSNVSHGLPQRAWLNSTFLALALGAGLDAPIANPMDSRIKETLISSALLTGRDYGARNYLLQAGSVSTPVNILSDKEEVSLETLGNYIFQGLQGPIIPALTKLLVNIDPMVIINQGIIPPLEKMGDQFARGEAYLPQLMLAGDAAKTAFTLLKEKMPQTSIEYKGTIVLGTVSGDVHDIGKNIVAALLENHGFKVIDLGKNVPISSFIDAARREKAQIVGLSALMTTTMVNMETIINEFREANLKTKIIVGGAVVNPEYAQSIGADGYGKDAVEAVKIVRKLLEGD